MVFTLTNFVWDKFEGATKPPVGGAIFPLQRPQLTLNLRLKRRKVIMFGLGFACVTVKKFLYFFFTIMLTKKMFFVKMFDKIVCDH